MAHNVISLEDMYGVLGEEKTRSLLDEFECGLNKDVEYFIKEKAIEFLKSGISKTFLVTSSFKDKQVIVGYFALTNKITKIRKIRKSTLNSNCRKRLNRFANKDESDNKNFSVSLPLIGQLSKNYKNGYNTLISGDLLLKLACDKVR